ncbi:DoxX family membrane protein [Streptosporangium sp. NPDC051022]|uniref:DoxX family membrane protein n=1 Tax=Streptosporangium sp. NPDC051022 TaxID=3155752 RepID=UPI0034365BD9
MRVTLGLVFLWFGALKVADVSPVSDLVADTLAFVPLPASFVVPALGVFEIAAALALISGRWMRPFLPALLLHLIGTFLVLALHPSVAFKNGNPLLLTMEGEFVVKNLVLIAGTLMIAATLPSRRETAHPADTPAAPTATR